MNGQSQGLSLVGEGIFRPRLLFTGGAGVTARVDLTGRFFVVTVWNVVVRGFISLDRIFSQRASDVRLLDSWARQGKV